ncbi:MAG TPA: DJ-1/PfpI/YhbO family deglycase/protease [bacterium]|nr:DJ-1/PfpI/YhbO family deglycase/protease [bacterium]
MLKDKRIAILIGPQFHDEEATLPKEYLQKLGAQVDWVGLDRSTLIGKYNRVSLTPDKTIDEIRAADYDGLIIPGGGAPERIRVNDAALALVKAFWQTGRPVGAICHGAQVLISAGLLEGVTTTCFVGIRDDVKLAGAHYVDQEVCVDGPYISSRKPEDLPAFNKAFSEAVAGIHLHTEVADLDPLASLQLAISREKGAMEFYRSAAAVMKQEKIRNKFTYFGAIEQGHFDQLSELYVKLSGGQAPAPKVTAQEIGSHQVSADLSSEEAIRLAMQAEEKAYQFYRQAALKARHSKAKEMFEYLAAEEIEHKRLLSVDRSTAAGGQGHFQWATHWDVPPGMEDLW